MRWALCVLGLMVFTPGCKDSTPNDNAPPDDAGQTDAGGSDGGPTPPDGGREPTGDGGVGDGGSQPSEALGFIDYVLPASDAEAVARNAHVIVGFTEALDATTVNEDVLTVWENGVSLQGTLAHDATTRTLAFTPARPFTADALVTVVVSSLLRSATGKSLEVPHHSLFTVGFASDTSPPSVVSVKPLLGVTDVPSTWPVYVLTFSEPMDPSTLTADSLQFEQQLGSNPASPLSGTYSYDAASQSVYFRVSPPPAPGARVTCTLSTKAKDLAGNSLIREYTHTFLVALSRDTLAPRVQATLPEASAVGVAARQAPLLVRFSEPLRPESITPDRLFLEELNEDGTQVVRRVPGTLRYDDARLQVGFTPHAPLKYQTRYRGQVRLVEDLAGNRLVPFEGFGFVTELQPSPPRVVEATPAPDTRFVPLSGPLRVRFDRPLDRASITPETVSVAGVTGVANYESSTNTVAFRQLSPFAPATEYTMTVKDVRTPQGVSLASPFTYTIRTVAPGVRVSAGSPGQAGVPVFATGPLGTLAVWNENTGTGVQVRASLNRGAGFGESLLVGEGSSMKQSPQVAAWDQRFIVGWSDPALTVDAVALFDGTAFTPVTPGIRGRLFGFGNTLYAYDSDSGAFRVRSGEQWLEVTRKDLGTSPTLLSNAGALLFMSGPDSFEDVTTIFDGVQWVHSGAVGTSVEKQYILVGDSFGRAWSNSEGTWFSLFNRTTRAWGPTEFITSSQARNLRIASDGNTVTALFIRSDELTAAVRVNGEWQALVRLPDSGPTPLPVAMVSYQGNYTGLLSASSSSQLRFITQVGGSWTSVTRGVVATGMNAVLETRAVGNEVLVLMRKNGPVSTTHEVWATALTPQGWQPSVQLRGAESTPVVSHRVGDQVNVSYVAPGQLSARGYQGGGQWGAATQMVTPPLVGGVREAVVDFSPDGAGAAAWEQFDGGVWSLFLAEYDGEVWHQPVRLGPVGSKVRVAVDGDRVVVAYLKPSTTTGQMDIWAVSYVAGVLGTPVKLDSVTGTDPDLVLVHGASGFMVAWGQWEIRSALSVDGTTWSTPQLAAERTSSTLHWQYTRLIPSGASFVLSTKREGGTLNILRMYTSGVWLPRVEPVLRTGIYDLVATDSTVMVMAPLASEFRYMVHNGVAWSNENTVASPGDGQGLMAVSPSGIRMHTDVSWWRWTGTEWLKEATRVSRPSPLGDLRCDAKGCGLVTGPGFGGETDLSLSYASGTRSFWRGAVPHEGPFPVQPRSVTWDFAGSTYRVTWRQAVAPGMTALHASTKL
ncbi:Ig-like domain-containing protein [Myxococcus landrumensis]|uniref:Ig-like domain-containing protein n=1 Tax=Myxococcus landrumensis TaxID=2813577 RepID=A0ABX7MZZ2_9BACT|nr:Ig-like domain-containing protein [Myxococcus landrumus]QSQ12005.1 Ig-like domain-containing protein [Myxococcus landrumus]